MEYKGNVPGKRVDFKRRFSLPVKWIDTTTEFCFVANLAVQANELRIYPYDKWKEELLNVKTTDDERKDFAKRTTHVELKQGRLLLPKGYIWKKVDLIGVLDFIIVIESM
jgi:DNA-binding transcriptional regulator/RsmH inhibitor MraZ